MDQRRLERRSRLLRSLPPLEEVLRGSIVERTVRCGSAGCHCASGPGHRVTAFSVTFPGGRTEQISLPPDLVPLARRWVGNYRRWTEAVEKISAINRDLLREQRKAAARKRRPPRRR